MKIAYFGYDFFVAVLDRLVADGHDVTHIFTCEFPSDDAYNSNIETIQRARSLSAALQTKKPPAGVLDDLAASDCELALVAGYIHKLPPSSSIRALNLHPTLLPEGRGSYPLPWLILRRPECAGLTLHKLSDEMDAGDVVAQSTVPLDGSETLELLVARLQFAAPPFVSDTIRDLDRLWLAARPQGAGSTWKATEADWTLDWTADVASILRTVRAFGRLETAATLDGQSWAVTSAEGWVERHAIAPGTVVHRFHSDLLVAARDGFVLLKQPRLELLDQ